METSINSFSSHMFMHMLHEGGRNSLLRESGEAAVVAERNRTERVSEGSSRSTRNKEREERNGNAKFSKELIQGNAGLTLVKE